MTTFQEPSRKKEGTNLRQEEQRWRGHHGDNPVVPKALPGAPVVAHGLGHLGCTGRCCSVKWSWSTPVSVHTLSLH